MTKSFSIIIPAYKEEERIENTLMGILKSFRNKKLDFEIITVIDKAQNDRTFSIVYALSNFFREIKIISREGKQGVASAIKEGIKKSTKDVILIAMADTSEDPEDLTKIALKMNDDYDMVFANRFSKNASFQRYPLKKYILNRLCNLVVQIFFRINSKDITNAVKAYKSIILKNMIITSSGFEVFVELPIRAYINGYKNFAELAVSHDAGDPSKSKFSASREGPKYIKVIINCLLQKTLR